MTADPAEAVRKHRIDLLHMGGTLAALIETVPGDGHLLIANVAVSPAFQKAKLHLAYPSPTDRLGVKR